MRRSGGNAALMLLAVSTPVLAQMEIVFLDEVHTRRKGPIRMMEITSTRRGR